MPPCDRAGGRQTPLSVTRKLSSLRHCLAIPSGLAVAGSGWQTEVGGHRALQGVSQRVPRLVLAPPTQGKKKKQVNALCHRPVQAVVGTTVMSEVPWRAGPFFGLTLLGLAPSWPLPSHLGAGYLGHSGCPSFSPVAAFPKLLQKPRLPSRRCSIGVSATGDGGLGPPVLSERGPSLPGWALRVHCEPGDQACRLRGLSPEGFKLLSFFSFFINVFIYLLAATGFCCCAQAFSSCGERGLPFVVAHGLLVAVASLVVEHGL